MKNKIAPFIKCSRCKQEHRSDIVHKKKAKKKKTLNKKIYFKYKNELESGFEKAMKGE